MHQPETPQPSDASLAPWNASRHPTDRERTHVELIDSGRHEYSIVQGGTMDGENCRTPLGCGMSREGACEQTWESNRLVHMANEGETDVIDPWLSNGRNDFRSVGQIVASALEPGMSDRDKAVALWFQEIRHRYHFSSVTPADWVELENPVKVFNVYGYNTCGNDATCMATLWSRAGLEVARSRLVGHCVSHARYDGGWHLLDGDGHSLYLRRDNRTVASDADIASDHDLVKRTHVQGILVEDDRARDERGAAIFVCESEPTPDHRERPESTMSMVLRPREAITWRWGYVKPVKFHGPHPPLYPSMVCNGLWEYRPDFARESWRRGAQRVENIVLRDGALAAADGGEGLIEWTIACPYVIVGGRLQVDGRGAAFTASFDGDAWQEVGQSLDELFIECTARYQYRLRCRLAGGATLSHLAVVNDLQMAPLALPGMRVGENRFTYTDRTPGDRRVRITHGWVERSAAEPPGPPPAPIHPPDGGSTEGTGIVFEWRPPGSPGGTITDYRFELSDEPTMRWPLSMSFYKLISRTADRGRAQYTTRRAGLLNPDCTYYWRVRAKNDAGIWGPWSEVWRFTARGPGVPLAVKLDWDQERATGTLHWQANPEGRPPVAYRVYGSDEKGFSVSDEPYAACTGELPGQFAANFVAETAATQLAVVGPGVDLPGANKAFFRVVAVDEKGNRSGPSEYAPAPRPVIYSRPVRRAGVCTPYRYLVKAIRSIGDLSTRLADGRQQTRYWDVERLRFSIRSGPDWLRIDENSGLLFGTPDAAGGHAVTLAVALMRTERRLDEEQLVWGHEKVLSADVMKAGEWIQEFVIEVAPWKRNKTDVTGQTEATTCDSE